MAIKAPRINKRTKVGQLMNGPLITQFKFKTAHGTTIKKKLNIKGKIHKEIKKRFINGGDEKYIVSGNVKLRLVGSNGIVKNINRKYSFAFNAKDGLNRREIRAVVYEKLYDYYKTPQDGNSSNEVMGFSINLLQIPDDFKFHHNVKLFERKNLQYKLFDSLSKGYVKNDEFNCMFKFLYTELRKKYKNVTKKGLSDTLSKYCIDYEYYGCSLEGFELFIKNEYPNVSYDVVGPDYNIIMRKTSDKRQRDGLILTCYVNNSHVYPINDLTKQKHIRQLKNKNIKNYFNELHTVNFHQEFKYVETYDDLDEGVSYICNKDDDMKNLLCDAIKDTNHGVEYIDMDMSTGKITKFKHPVKDYMICEYNDFHLRKKTHGQINEMLKGQGLGKFTNQSFATMAKELLNHYGSIPTSTYNKESFYYLEEYTTQAMYEIVRDVNITNEKVYGVDFYKQYASIYNKDLQELQIPIYDVHNTVKKYNGEKITLGEYYIKQVEFKGVRFGGYFVHSHIINKLLKYKVIKTNDIELCINTNKFHSPTSYKKFVETTAKLDVVAFKKINNFLNGTLKNSKTRKAECHFTNDINALSHLIIKAEGEGKEYVWQTDEETGYNFLKVKKTTENYENTSSFYRATLSCSLFQIVELVAKASKYGEIVKVQTDAVYYVKSDKRRAGTLEVSNMTGDIMEDLGKFEEEPITSDLLESRYECKDLIEYEEKRILKLNIGSAGSGKSCDLIINCPENKNVLLTSHTNKAVIELKQKTIEFDKDITNWEFNTLSRIFINSKTLKAKINKLNTYDYIIIDEIFITNQEHLRAIFNCDTTLYLAGDVNQLPPIVTGNDESYNLMTCGIFKHFNVNALSYREDSARFTKESYDVFETFNKSGLKKDLKKIKEFDPSINYPFYLCCYNKTKRKYITKACNYYHKGGFNMKFIEFDRVTGKDTYIKVPVGVNMPVICTKTVSGLKKDYGVFNNWNGTLNGIDKAKKEVTLKGYICVDNVISEDVFNVSFELFKRYFLPLYASTIHKFQGGKIEGEYAILDTNAKMCNLNSLYTSITRSTDYKNISIQHNILKDKYIKTQYFNTAICMTQPNKKGHIHKVNYKCDCGTSKKEFFMYSPKKTINPHYRDVHHMKECECSKTLVYSGVHSLYTFMRYCKMLSTVDIVAKPVELEIYREINKKLRPRIRHEVGAKKLHFIYYEDDTKKTFKMKYAKKGLSKTLDEMKDKIKNLKIDVRLLTCKDSELSLSFD